MFAFLRARACALVYPVYLVRYTSPCTRCACASVFSRGLGRRPWPRCAYACVHAVERVCVHAWACVCARAWTFSCSLGRTGNYGNLPTLIGKRVLASVSSHMRVGACVRRRLSLVLRSESLSRPPRASKRSACQCISGAVSHATVMGSVTVRNA
eukprot:220753-Pleurochrysis_carterae.AAC.2